MLKLCVICCLALKRFHDIIKCSTVDINLVKKIKQKPFSSYENLKILFFDLTSK